MEGCMADLSGLGGAPKLRPARSGALRASTRPRGAASRTPSAVVAAAGQDVAVPPAEELREVLARDRVEIEIGLRRDLRDVPQHVAELLRQRRAALVGQDAAVVADHLLDLLGHLAGLTAQTERGVEDVVPRPG